MQNFLFIQLFLSIIPISGEDMADQKNVYGKPLQTCSTNPMTGYHRDGYARWVKTDRGQHTLCAQMTTGFLNFTKTRGNDLSTPHPPWFPGLKAGDFWALCAARWYEAQKAGFAPLVKTEATNQKALDIVPLDVLEQYKVHSAQQNKTEL